MPSRGLLAWLERAGNRLPDPAVLFAGLALLVILLSGLAASLGLSVLHPATGQRVEVVNLLSVDGLQRILTGLVGNFTAFAPLGAVLVSMLGLGIAERAGFIGAALRLVVGWAPQRLLTAVIVLSGVLSNAASDVGYVLLIPLAGTVFLAVGRHPVVGMAAAFAGVSGGFSANLLLGTVDPLLAGLTQEAAHIVTPSYSVHPAANYYFMAVSTFLITALGTWVTTRFVEPRLGVYQGAEVAELRPLEPSERKGLRATALALGIFGLVLLLGLIPEGGFLREPRTGSVLHGPFLKGVVAFIFLGGLLAAWCYGRAVGTVRTPKDLVKAMSDAMGTMGSYLVLCFFAAQFVALFNATNLGMVLAVKGADILKGLQLPLPLLIVVFVAFSALVNLLMGSASAKWAILAPVFVPLFMLLGYTPELTQAAFRVGDSVTNIISPTMSFLPLILVGIQRYLPQAGLGTLIAAMLPYSITFFLGWTALLLLWIVLGLPLGPGAGLRL